MWIVAAIAAGTIWRWPFVFVFAKPTFAPIAFLGVRRRSWWVALGRARRWRALLFLPVWFDWFTVVRNSDVSLLYNLPTLPLMLAPLVAWATGRDRPALPPLIKPAQRVASTASRGDSDAMGGGVERLNSGPAISSNR